MISGFDLAGRLTGRFYADAFEQSAGSQFAKVIAELVESVAAGGRARTEAFVAFLVFGSLSTPSRSRLRTAECAGVPVTRLNPEPRPEGSGKFLFDDVC